MTEAEAATVSRPCSACAHFVVDGGHPLHAALCGRLGGRMLSAAAERAAPEPSCGPEGRDFVAKPGTANP